jgi:hypothetical protein
MTKDTKHFLDALEYTTLKQQQEAYAKLYDKSPLFGDAPLTKDKNDNIWHKGVKITTAQVGAYKIPVIADPTLPKHTTYVLGFDPGVPFPSNAERYAEVCSGDWFELSSKATEMLAPHAPSARDLDMEFVRELRAQILNLEVAAEKPSISAAKCAIEVQPGIYGTFECAKVYALARIPDEAVVAGNVDRIRGAFFEAAREAARAFLKTRPAQMVRGCPQIVLRRRLDNFFGVLHAHSKGRRGSAYRARPPNEYCRAL